mmetsp:Transcript_46269/g.86395  ORF Transcript_46269/g.86395 Transcript_46269/m.86395 type:complete len:344 (+) Transcript_46269:105-1136(+)
MSARDMEAEDLLSSDEDSSEAPGEDDLPFVIRHAKTTNFVAVLLFILLGVGMIRYYEDWSLATCFYVIVQIVTTVGYGDLVPSNSGQVFLTFYVLLGTILIANVLNELVQSLVSISEARLSDTFKDVRESLSEDGERLTGSLAGIIPSRLKRIAASNLMQSSLIYLSILAGWTLFFAFYENCSCSYGESQIEGCQEDRCEETGGATIDIPAGIYMGVITFSTVGFGDLSPKTQLGRIVGSLVMVMGILAFGNVVADVCDLIDNWKKTHKRRILASRKLFQEMDGDGSGRVYRHEFRQYMLIRQGLVTLDVFNEIDKLFDSLDLDKTDSLSFDEINGKLLPFDA